jgi:hypothetical protein
MATKTALTEPAEQQRGHDADSALVPLLLALTVVTGFVEDQAY